MKIEELLLSLLPLWNYRIAKPFKQLLEKGISLEMYYCIKTLQWGGGIMSMSELCCFTNTPKDQMTKMSNRLVEHQLVERVFDPSDRRIIKLRLTDKAQVYIDHFIEHDAQCFAPLLSQLNDEDLKNFEYALKLILDIFFKLPCDSCKNDSSSKQ